MLGRPVGRREDGKKDFPNKRLVLGVLVLNGGEVWRRVDYIFSALRIQGKKKKRNYDQHTARSGRVRIVFFRGGKISIVRRFTRWTGGTDWARCRRVLRRPNVVVSFATDFSI